MKLPQGISETFVILILTISRSCTGTQVENIRKHLGLDSSTSVPGGTVVVLLSNGSVESPVNVAQVLDEEDIISLASDVENDPNSLFVHFNGDRLVTSHTDLFNDINDSGDSWSKVLEIVKSDRKKGRLGDLVILDSYPPHVSEEISSMCDSGLENCKIVKAVVQSDASNFRMRREAQSSSTTPPNPNPRPTPRDKANIPVVDFPAAFQLLFWTSTIIALTVWGVSYGMWNMDPGRDSIIYRMTSAQKYKKDK